MGKRGRSTSQILRRAFPGVRFSRLPQAPIRVALADKIDSAIATGQTPLTLSDGGNPAFAPVVLPAEHRFEIKLSAKGRFVVADLDALTPTSFTLKGPALLDPLGAPSGIRLAKPIRIDRRYRGVLKFQKSRTSGIAVVNVVDVEDYVLGTLPGDMPPAWGIRAPSTLRAGAVALRSRALTQRKNDTAPFDFTADDPLYLGLDGERARTDLAAQQTRGLTLRKGGYPFPASFSGDVVMGRGSFKPREGNPLPVAFGPTKPVEGAAAGKAQKALDLALSFLGVPYLWGGTSPAGFDCSGLVYYVYAQVGVKLPRVAADQARVGQPVTRIQDLLPGDAVFFADSSGYIHHMGLYVGGGKMVHAPHTGDVVKLEDITAGYYLRQFAGGRRYVPAPNPV